MKPQRLWPVVSALVAMLVGAVVLESMAERRGTKTEVIEIHDSSASSESESDVSDGEWAKADPVNDDHARCRTLARRRDYAGAAALMEILVASRPDDGVLLAEFGHLLRKAGDEVRALETLQRAREIAPNTLSIQLDLALIYEDRGDLELADRAFLQAVKTRPNHTPTLLAYGKFLRESKRYDESIAILEGASDKGSNQERARAFSELAQSLVEAGRVDEGRKALNASIERAPSVSQVWIDAARTLLISDRVEDREEALEYALNGVKLAPGLASAHSVLGRAYESLERSDDAIDAYERAVSLDPSLTFARQKLVRIRMERDEHDSARVQVKQLIEAEPDKREYLFLAGSVELGAGDYEAASKRFGAAVDTDAEPYPEAWYNLGIVYRRLDQLDQSIAAYEKAILDRPDYKAAWNNLGLSYLDADDIERAESSFRRALIIDPDYASAWANLARMYSDRDRHDEATHAYRRLTELRPRDRGARLKLAIELRRADKLDEAIDVYEALTREEPKYSKAWYNLGIAYNAADRYEDARRAYERALAVDPNHRKAMKNLGLLLARREAYPQAEKYLSDVLDFDPGDNTARYRLAAVHRELGHPDVCRNEARKVLSVDPESTRAKRLARECETLLNGASK